MKGTQNIINAQVSVNRAVFELNSKSWPFEPREPDSKELKKHVESAIKDLQEYLNENL